MSPVCRTCLAAICVGALFVAASPPSRAQSSQTPDPTTAGAGFTPEFAELMRVQLSIVQVLARAFELNPGLHVLRTAYEEALHEAMVALDPETTTRLARMAELESQYGVAAANEDIPSVEAMIQEGRDLSRALRETAAEARRQPAVAALADDYLAALRERVAETGGLDPDVVQILTEGDALIELVSAAGLVGR